MASLVQSPDSISLLGNLKAYKISAAGPVSFKLTHGESTVVEETYYPDDDNMITIDVKDVVKQYVKVSLPSVNIFNQSVEEFSAYIDDVFIASFKVIPGGVRRLSETPRNFLKGNWLTWQPRNKRVRINQPEKLTYYHVVAGDVKVKFYLVAGGTEIITLSSGQAGDYVTYNVEPEHLISLSSHDQEELTDTIDIWVEDESGARLSYIQRFVINPETRDENYYLCVNSLGGIDTFCFTGTRSLAPSVAHGSGVINDELVDIKSGAERVWTQNTGYLNATELAWLWDFVSSSEQWAIIDGDIDAIVLDSSGIDIPEDANATACDFSYRLSEDGMQQNAARSRESFRTVKLMSPSGQQLVLTPRLADYPSATISDSLLFLAQTPYVEEWKQLSLGAIREWIQTVMPIITIIDSLTSDRRDLALSAYQGKVLKALIDAKVIEAGGVPFDAEPTQDSENAVFSGGVYDAIAAVASRGYVFAGIAHPDDPVFSPEPMTYFIAAEVGSYVNYGELSVASGEIAVLKYDGSNFSKDITGIEKVIISPKAQGGGYDINVGDGTHAEVVKYEEGKGLSDENYTEEDKSKLEELPSGQELDEEFDSIRDGVQRKANKDGYYSQMAVGAADNLVGRGDAVPALFSRRTTGGSASVEDGVATIKRIKGKSIVWNQLVNSSMIGTSGSNNGITYTYDGKYITLNGTASAVSTSDAALGIYAPALVYGHKYYFGYVGDSSMYIQYYAASAEEGANKNIGSTSGIATMNFHPIGTCRFRVRVASGKVCSNVRIPFEIFDLTQMFGAGNEPTSVDEFRTMFPLDSYEYNAGELISFKGEAIKTDGFNQWDEEWEIGSIDNTTGQPVADTSMIRSKNFIPIIPEQDYYFKHPFSYVYLYFYDDENVYLGVKEMSASGLVNNIDSRARYMKFRSTSGYAVYNHDINLNFSHSGYRDGEYEEHWESERNLPGLDNFNVQYTRAAGGTGVETGIKSALSAHDEQTATKDVRRIEVIDLGTLTYTYSGGTFKSTTVLPNVKEPSSGVTPNAVCKLYVSRNYDDFLRTDKSFNIIFPSSAQHGRIWINDSSYTNAAAFKAAMAGVLLFYERDTPIETDIAEPRNLQYRVSDFGTETILPQGTDELHNPLVPISADIIYGPNAVDTLRNLPRNFVSEQSLRNLLGALSDAGIIFDWTMEFNPNTNNFDFEIIPA